MIGNIRAHFLDTPYSLTEGRVLYELAHREAATAKTLPANSASTPAIWSRILRKFEEAGLIEKETSPTDARQTLLKLTHRGRAAFAELNQLSTRQACNSLTVCAH